VQAGVSVCVLRLSYANIVYVFIFLYYLWFVIRSGNCRKALRKKGVEYMEKSRFRSMSPMIVAWMIILLVAQSSAQVCKPASKGRLNNITGTYDLAIFPASSFRSDMDVMYFQVWPENITHPRFRFVCQDGSNLSLVNFTATCDQTTGRLDPRPYYDVGAADDLRPYYKHWTYSEIIPTTYIQLFCERGDMRRLYSHRY
jgi:hypothetical protein